MKINVGDKFPDLEAMTANNTAIAFKDVIEKSKYTVIHFLRFYGCSICQLNLHEYNDKYEEYVKNNIGLIVILQSASDTINASGINFKYPIVCDPKRKLYNELEIIPAKKKLNLVSIKTFKRLKMAKQRGIVAGNYEGEKFQRPAMFIVDAQGKTVYAKYAKNLGEIPNSAETLDQIKSRY